VKQEDITLEELNRLMEKLENDQNPEK